MVKLPVHALRAYKNRHFFCDKREKERKREGKERKKRGGNEKNARAARKRRRRATGVLDTGKERVSQGENTSKLIILARLRD